MNTSHQEFKPSAQLQPFVDHYWLHCFETVGQGESPIHRCLPFGTLEIIIQLDDSHCQVLVDSHWQRLPHAFFTGLYQDAVQWKCVGTGRKFGIQFKPENLLRLFNVPVASLFNNFTDLETFFGRNINRLLDTVYGLQDINAVIDATEAFLLSQLRNLNAERNYLFEATRLIRQSKGALSIGALSEHLSISKRQLERSFKDNYGPTPKMYQRIIRFRSAYEYFHQTSTAPDWQDISYNFGYSDQAHFIRDFKEFTDEVPTVVFTDTGQYARTAACWGIYVTQMSH